MPTVSERKNSSGSTAARCGRIRFSLAGAPAISEISPSMRSMLGIQGDGQKWLNAIRDNPGLIMPEEYERQFASRIQSVRESGAPASFEGEVYAIDHRRLPVVAIIDADGLPGEERYVSYVYDMRPVLSRDTDLFRTHYLSILQQSCEWICEIDLPAGTTRCLYSRKGYADQWIRVSLSDALQMRIEQQVSPHDQGRVRQFFDHVLIPGRSIPYSEQIDFDMAAGQVGTLPYHALVVSIGSGRFLFCGMPRFYPEGADGPALSATASDDASIIGRGAFELRCLRNRQSRQWNSQANLFLIISVDGFECYSLEECDRIQQTIMALLLRWRSSGCVVSRFAENLFVLCQQGLNPGHDQRAMTEKLFRNLHMALRPFGATVSIGASNCPHDMENGFRQAYDEAHQAQAVAREAGGGRYAFYSEDIHREAIPRNRIKNHTEKGHIVDIVTFGNFNVLVDGVPVFFRHEKSRELLALLVDRRGSYATAASLISFLWEDEGADERTYARLRKVAMRLRNTLRAYEVEDIVESISGKRHVVVEKVNCDLYEYLSRDKSERPKFRGSYLVEYSWSEDTLGELLSDI